MHFILNLYNKLCPCYIYSNWDNKFVFGGDSVEKVYDTRNRVQGYVDNNTIYDRHHNIMGYTDGQVLYDQYMYPLAYLEDGYVLTMDGRPLGYYNGYKLYDVGGNYLGYGNFGFFGLLGASFLFLLFAGLSGPRWWWW
jgi:hypothetical protein